MKTLKLIGFICAIIYITSNIILCVQGKNPSWIGFFVAWGYILFEYIIDIITINIRNRG